MRPDLVTPYPKPDPRPKARKRMKASHGNKVPKATLDALKRRCGGRCEGLAPRCWGPPEHPHHRRVKAQGVDHRLLNLLALCEGCHTYIHAHVDWSNRHGLILAAGDDPELIVPGCSFDCEIDHRALAGVT